MPQIRRVISLTIVAAISTLVLAVGPATAADSPTFRDCSFVGGLDPDFVQLINTTADATVAPNQNTVQMLASESSDPGDSGGHVTFTATVASPGLPMRSASGAGTGRVVLSLPLLGSSAGRTYTIRWSAVFDSGGHPCPGTTLATTTSGAPFTIRVSKSS